MTNYNNGRNNNNNNNNNKGGDVMNIIKFPTNFEGLDQRYLDFTEYMVDIDDPETKVIPIGKILEDIVIPREEAKEFEKALKEEERLRWKDFYEGRETSCAFGVYLESVRRDKREKLLEGKIVDLNRYKELREPIS